LGPDTGQAAHVRPFSDVLSEINKGVIADDAATLLAQLVTAVQETGRKGTLKLVIEVAPVKGNDSIVQVSGAVDARPPKAAASTSFFYPDEDGNLSRNDPNTLPGLSERDLPGVSTR